MRYRALLSLVLASTWGLVALPLTEARAGAELVAAALWFESRAPKAGDELRSYRLRNPLVVRDILLMRGLPGTGIGSSIFAYSIPQLLGGLRTWQADPFDVSPSWKDVTSRSSFGAPVNRVTSLYRGPGYGAVSGEGRPQLVGLSDGRFQEIPGDGFPKGIAVVANSWVVASEGSVVVTGKTWFDCASQGDCKAVSNLGLDAADVDGSPSRPVLAVGFADASEAQWVCAITAPGQRCAVGAPDDDPGNRVPGRQPVLSSDGSWLAVAEPGGEAGDRWVIQVYRVDIAAGGVRLEPEWRSPPIRLYGQHGAGGDYLEYKGSYGWAGEHLYFQEQDGSGSAGGVSSVARWRPGDAGVSRIALPTELRVVNPFVCDSPANRAWNEAGSQELLLWTPERAEVGCEPAADAQSVAGYPEHFDLSLVDAYAVAPYAGPEGTYLFIHGLLKTANRRTLERVLVFRLGSS